MKTPPRFGTGAAIAGAAIVLGSAVAMGVLLASLSAPQGFGVRLAALAQQADEAKRLARPVRVTDPLAADVACARPAPEQSETLRASLASGASGLGLSVTRLEVSPQGSAGPSAGVTPIVVRVDASGSYEAALGLLAQLHKASPQIFADSVDLVSKTSSVSISFTGRAFCAA
jgi:hypothetical protein